MPIILVPLVGFGLLLAWLVLFGMHRSINDWLVPFLTGLAHPHGSILTRSALKAAGFLGGGVLWIVNRVDHAITKAASHVTPSVAHWFHGLASWITHVALGAEQFAEDVAHGFERLVAHTIPHEIALGTRPLWHRIRADRRYLLGLLLPEILLGKWLYGQLRHHVLPRLRYLYHQTTVALPRAIERVGGRVGALERALSNPSPRWLRRIARRMWLLALFGLLIRTLARRFPWLFCRKVKSVGNRLCGLDQDLLNALLLDTVLIAGTISVVEFARDMQAIEGAAVGVMRDFIREL